MAAFFGNIKGYYVEVGANDPRERSQTWHLEQQGWTGVLIEPQPDLAATLRAERKGKVFAVACSSPVTAGQELPLHVAGPLSSLDRRGMAPGAIPEVSQLMEYHPQAPVPPKISHCGYGDFGHPCFYCYRSSLDCPL